MPNLKIEISGKYVIEVLSDKGEINKSYEFENLILNSGLNGAGTTSVFTNCYVGTGSTPPEITDISLQEQIATTSTHTTTKGVNASNGYAWMRRTWSFTAGSAAGNLSEVGVGPGLGNLFSRSLIKDSSGNPTTITVLPSEVLRVTWEFRRYWPSSDVTGVIANSGNKGGDYAWTARPSLIGSWDASANEGFVRYTASTAGYYAAGSDIGPIDGSPTGTMNTALSSSASVYVNNSYSAKAALSWSISQGNAGISCLSFTFSGMVFQVKVEPSIPKTNLDTLRIDVTVSWARRP